MPCGQNADRDPDFEKPCFMVWDVLLEKDLIILYISIVHQLSDRNFRWLLPEYLVLYVQSFLIDFVNSWKE